MSDSKQKTHCPECRNVLGELLEAAKLAMRWFDTMDPGRGGSAETLHLRAAIAKAEGRERQERCEGCDEDWPVVDLNYDGPTYCRDCYRIAESAEGRES